MVDIQLEQLREQFMGYLKRTFGEEFLRLIDEPKGVQIGERVLYKLKDEKKVERHELSKQEIEEMRQEMVNLAKSTGVDESAVTFEPPISSGVPYPRLMDLPGSEIMWDKELKKYLQSDDLLPSHDFFLEWVIGILLMSSEKMLMYLDFTHPKVKAIFRVCYDSEYDAPSKASILDRFKQFREKEGELKTQIENEANMLWVKIVQLDMETVCIKIKDAKTGGSGYATRIGET